MSDPSGLPIAPAAPGIRLFPGLLDGSAQAALLDAVVAIVRVAPFFRPVMPRTGTPFSVMMTNAGPLGWVSDLAGYRYQRAHPVTGAPWPPLPGSLLALWADLAPAAPPPEACLVNWYQPGARMGLHQDRDEDDLDAPVVSVSLGDTAVFRVGGLTRRGPTTSVRLASGDVVVIGPPSRLAFHGIDRTLAGTSTLLGRHPELFPGGGRVNLTLRRVTRG